MEEYKGWSINYFEERNLYVANKGGMQESNESIEELKSRIDMYEAK